MLIGKLESVLREALPLANSANRLEHSLLCVRELQADQVEDLGSMWSGEILDKLAELHLAVRLPCHINHINDFVATYMGDKYHLVRIKPDGDILLSDTLK